MIYLLLELVPLEIYKGLFVSIIRIKLFITLWIAILIFLIKKGM